MPLPRPERVLFARPPLKQVIAQVRYAVLPRFEEPGFVAPFIESLKADFPKVSREVQRKILVSSGEGVSVGASETLWRLQSSDGKYAGVLAENAITLEISEHRSIQDLTCHFGLLLEAVVGSLGVTSRGRLGLRYINEFRSESATLAEWGRLLNPDFLGVGATDRLEGGVEKMMQEMQVRRSDGILTIRHGLVPAALDDAGPQPSRAGDAKSTYLLDLDYYDPEETQLDVRATLEQLERYSEFMYSLFRWTLGSELYKLLEPEEHDN